MYQGDCINLAQEGHQDNISRNRCMGAWTQGKGAKDSGVGWATMNCLFILWPCFAMSEQLCVCYWAFDGGTSRYPSFGTSIRGDGEDSASAYWKHYY